MLQTHGLKVRRDSNSINIYWKLDRFENTSNNILQLPAMNKCTEASFIIFPGILLVTEMEAARELSTKFFLN